MKPITVIVAVLVMPALAFGGATVTLIDLTGTSMSHKEIKSAPSQNGRIDQDYRRVSGSDCGLMAATAGLFSNFARDMHQNVFEAGEIDAQLLQAPLNTALSAGRHLAGFYPAGDEIESSTDHQAVTVQKVDTDKKRAAIGGVPVFTVHTPQSAGMMLLAGTMPFICRRRWASK